MTSPFVDIHCHLLPGLDDGPRGWDESLAMAQLAVDDGTTAIVATPHQLGSFADNRGDHIRNQVAELRRRLDAARIPLRVLPGADVRIEPGMVEAIGRGDVLTLGDHRRHVLLELPHELYLPLEPVVGQLASRRIDGILSHPERNQGILRQPQIIGSIVDAGCLIQITAGSLCGTFGTDSRELAEWLLRQGLVHFVASDGHGLRSRRPLLRRAYDRLVQIADEQTAIDLCCRNPARVASGRPVPLGRRIPVARPTRWWRRRAVV